VVGPVSTMGAVLHFPAFLPLQSGFQLRILLSARKKSARDEACG
jgi:hypothetical protein